MDSAEGRVLEFRRKIGDLAGYSEATRDWYIATDRISEEKPLVLLPWTAFYT